VFRPAGREGQQTKILKRRWWLAAAAAVLVVVSAMLTASLPGTSPFDASGTKRVTLWSKPAGQR
jgi:hypothetical protein